MQEDDHADRRGRVEAARQVDDHAGVAVVREGRRRQRERAQRAGRAERTVGLVVADRGAVEPVAGGLGRIVRVVGGRVVTGGHGRAPGCEQAGEQGQGTGDDGAAHAVAR